MSEVRYECKNGDIIGIEAKIEPGERVGAAECLYRLSPVSLPLIDEEVLEVDHRSKSSEPFNSHVTGPTANSLI